MILQNAFTIVKGCWYIEYHLYIHIYIYIYIYGKANSAKSMFGKCFCCEFFVTMKKKSFEKMFILSERNENKGECRIICQTQ